MDVSWLTSQPNDRQKTNLALMRPLTRRELAIVLD